MNSVALNLAMWLLGAAAVLLIYILLKHRIWHHRDVLLLAREGDSLARIYAGLVVFSILLGLFAAVTAR